MIGNKKSPMGMDAPSTDAVNRIVEGTTFEGNIRSQSNMRIDGTFEGDITTQGRLVVGPKGSIKGNVMCAHCEVEGTMEGQIEVAELMALKASAKVSGTVYYGQLSVEAGAQPVGTFHMGSRERKEAPMMGKPGAVNTLKGAEVETGVPQAKKPEAVRPASVTNTL
jgi:cytoskeletal protein CcmA (bactofilin family)